MRSLTCTLSKISKYHRHASPGGRTYDNEQNSEYYRHSNSSDTTGQNLLHTDIPPPCLPSAWKHSHTRVSSPSSPSWPSPRNGCSTTSSQAHYGQERPTSSMPWYSPCLSATLAHATQTPAASRMPGTRRSKPKMSVHVSPPRPLHASGIAESARCQSRHVPTTARSASGRSSWTCNPDQELIKHASGAS